MMNNPIFYTIWQSEELVEILRGQICDSPQGPLEQNYLSARGGHFKTIFAILMPFLNEIFL